VASHSPLSLDPAFSSREHTFSPRELADAVGVSESSMKRWIDAGEVAAARTAGGHRRVSRREAVRFIRARGLPVADLASLRLPELAGVPDAHASGPVTADALIEALQAGKVARVRALVLAEYVGGASVASLCDGLIRETLHRTGELWRRERTAGIGIEHTATDTFAQTLGQIRSLRPLPSAEAPVAVGGAISGDPYLIPSLMAAAVLEDLGYHVTNLGADTPAEVLVDTARRRDADLLWFSVSTAPSLDALRQAGEHITAGLQDSGVRVVVGGRKADERALPGLTVLPSMQALASVGEQVLATRRDA
jgi:excisionase family DNA binding protein